MQEITLEKSIELASKINMAKMFLAQIDLDYAKLAAKELREQASHQQSIAILNPRYDDTKNTLLYTQAEALRMLVSFIELLQECDELKAKVATNEEQYKEIDKLFL